MRLVQDKVLLSFDGKRTHVVTDAVSSGKGEGTRYPYSKNGGGMEMKHESQSLMYVLLGKKDDVYQWLVFQVRRVQQSHQGRNIRERLKNIGLGILGLVFLAFAGIAILTIIIAISLYDLVNYLGEEK